MHLGGLEEAVADEGLGGFRGGFTAAAGGFCPRSAGSLYAAAAPPHHTFTRTHAYTHTHTHTHIHAYTYIYIFIYTHTHTHTHTQTHTQTHTHMHSLVKLG